MGLQRVRHDHLILHFHIFLELFIISNKKMLISGCCVLPLFAEMTLLPKEI